MSTLVIDNTWDDPAKRAPLVLNHDRFDTVTAEIMAIGRGVSEVSQRNVTVDVANVMTDLRVGRTGTTIVDYAVRNAIRAAIENAARSLPSK